MKRFILFLFATLLTALSLEGLALAAAAIRITDNPANQGRPDVFGNIIVWKDYRNGNWDIYMYDLDLGTEHAVSTHPAYQNVPVTNGSLILWQDDRAGASNNDIYYTDYTGIGVGQEHLLVSGPGNQGQPVISGNTVAYVDDSSGNNDIYAIDMFGAVTPVSLNPASQWQPRIDGSRIVWEDNRNGNWDIYMYDLASGEEEQITTDPGDDKVADISGDRIVWQHTSGGVSDIWMKDLGTGTLELVTDDAAYQNSPRISGDVVVWENYDYALANWDIYRKDLTSGEVSPVAAGSGIEARPAFDREYVVWEASGEAGYDIWARRVEDTVSPVIASMTPAGGSDAGCPTPPVSASFSDNRTGIDYESVYLEVDGQDVTAGSQVTETGITYTPPEPLATGEHTVYLSLSDMAGNTGSSSWSFSYNDAPALSLSLLEGYWASFDDFESRDLSVVFRIANTSLAAAADVEILTSGASAGVSLASPMPLPLGDVQPAASSNMVLKYRVPGGVNSFKTVVYVQYEDACGGTHNSPGPPPNQ